MSLTQLHVLTSSSVATSTTSYEYFRNELLKQNENVNLKKYKANPYLGLHVDSAGHLAIGYGYDLFVWPASKSAATLTPYLASGVTITAQQIEYLNAFRGTVPRAINLAGDPLNGKIPTLAQVQAAWSNVTLASETRATEFLNAVAKTFEDQFPLSILPYSKERAAVISATYNVGGLAAMPSLKAALASDNRAEAWYQIRYNTNKLALSATPRDDAPGVANRRYRESDLFGLYDDPAQLTDAQKLEDAKGAYRMFTLHREDILKYESLYSPADANAGSIAIEQSLEYAKVLVLADLGNTTDPDIKAAYAAWIGNMPNFHTTDLYIDPTTGTFSEQFPTLIDARKYVMGAEVAGDNILVGEGKGGDLLVGGMGNDLLIGGAGSDVLYGGAGNDVMAGGAGDDTYILDGGGADTIEDKQGTNTVVFNGRVLGSFYRLTDGLTYMSYDGGFSAVMQGGDFIVTDKATGDKVTLNKNFQSGDFGITLTDAPVAPSFTLTGDLPGYIDKWGYADCVLDRLGNRYPAPNSQPSIVVDLLNGSNGNDRIYGGAQPITQDQAIFNGNNDTATGKKENWLSGRAGDDLLITGAGNDVLAGGGGNDTLIAGAGDDYIMGDADFVAPYTYGGVSSYDSVSNTYGSLAFFDINNPWTITQQADGTYVFENTGGQRNPADSGNDLIYAGAGNDIVWGGSGNDTIFGEGGDDTIRGDNGDGTGNQGNDTIDGGDGNDTIVGEGGNDILMGGAGDDTLTGEDAKLAIFDYIECFYNRNRIHQSLGYRTPDEVERLHYGA